MVPVGLNCWWFKRLWYFVWLSALQVYTTSYPSLQQEKVLKFVLVGELLIQVDRLRLRYQRMLRDREKDRGPKPGDMDSCPAPHLLLGAVFTEAEKARIESSPKPFCEGEKFYIPLQRLLTYPKLHRLCADEDRVRSLIADSVCLSSDGSAVVVDLHNSWDYRPEENWATRISWSSETHW